MAREEKEQRPLANRLWVGSDTYLRDPRGECLFRNRKKWGFLSLDFVHRRFGQLWCQPSAEERGLRGLRHRQLDAEDMRKISHLGGTKTGQKELDLASDPNKLPELLAGLRNGTLSPIAADKHGCTIMHMLASSLFMKSRGELTRIVKEMWRLGVSLDARTRTGVSPLFSCLSSGSSGTNMAAALVANGADVLSRTGTVTALQFAILLHEDVLANLILQRVVDECPRAEVYAYVNALDTGGVAGPDKLGMTAIHYAALCNPPMIYPLVENGAHVDTPLRYDVDSALTPLQIFCLGDGVYFDAERMSCISELVALGANVNALCVQDGPRGFHLLDVCRSTVASMLLRVGADPAKCVKPFAIGSYVTRRVVQRETTLAVLAGVTRGEFFACADDRGRRGLVDPNMMRAVLKFVEERKTTGELLGASLTEEDEAIVEQEVEEAAGVVADDVLQAAEIGVSRILGPSLRSVRGLASMDEGPELTEARCWSDR